MCDLLKAEIWIGGMVPESLAGVLCQAIADQRVALAWGGAEFHPRSAEELLSATQANAEGVRLLRLLSDRTHWGEFTRLERFLREHKIGYTRYSGGKGKCDPERVEHRPRQGLKRVATNSDREPILAAWKLAKLKARISSALERADRRAALRFALRRAEKAIGRMLPTPMPPLEPFEVLSAPVVEVAHG